MEEQINGLSVFQKGEKENTVVIRTKQVPARICEGAQYNKQVKMGQITLQKITAPIPHQYRTFYRTGAPNYRTNYRIFLLKRVKNMSSGPGITDLEKKLPHFQVGSLFLHLTTFSLSSFFPICIKNILLKRFSRDQDVKQMGKEN